MSRHPFGWSLPPGVTDRMIDEQFGGDEGCEDCGLPVDECTCQIVLEQCDCCGEMVPTEDIATVWAFGIETNACPKCREGGPR